MKKISLNTLVLDDTVCEQRCVGSDFRSLVEPSCRRGVAFSPADELGLTDLEMANDFEYDEKFYEDEPTFNIEYEVSVFDLCQCGSTVCDLCVGVQTVCNN